MSDIFNSDQIIKNKLKYLLKKVNIWRIQVFQHFEHDKNTNKGF